MNLLFICSRNQWRSPTAETLCRKHRGVSVRSAGTAKSAHRRVKAADIVWADLICVMEDHHKSRLLSEFRQDLARKRVEVLDVPDDYKYMDPELIEILRLKLQDLLP